MIKVVIFDMNGVLIDDEHIHELAFTKVIEQQGLNFTHQEFEKFCFGRTDKEAFENIIDQFHIDLDVDLALKNKHQIYTELFPVQKKTYPHVIDLVKELSKLHDLGVVSSASREELNMILHHLGIADYFSATVSADDITHGKPDPEPYLLISQELMVDPYHCIVIEDSPAGIASAKAADMKCIGITTTHNHDQLHMADWVVGDFREVKEIIDKESHAFGLQN